MSAHLSQTQERPTRSFRRTVKTWLWIAVAMTAISYLVTVPAQAAETAAPKAKPSAGAQDDEHSMEGMDHGDMDHDQMKGMDHDTMPDMKKPDTKSDATKTAWTIARCRA